MRRGPRARREQRGPTSLGTGSQEDGVWSWGSIHPSTIHLPINPSTYLPTHPFTHLFHPSNHSSAHPPIHTFIRPASSIPQESVCPPVQFSIYPIQIVSFHPIWESVSPTIDNLVCFYHYLYVTTHLSSLPVQQYRYSSPVLYKSLPLCAIQLLLSHQPGVTSGPPNLHPLVSLPCLLLFYCGWRLSQASCAAVF